MTNEKPFQCSRCARTTDRLSKPPYPGELGSEIERRVCDPCWKDWREMEVRVINELRLNFMEPAAQETLNQQLRQFLFPGDAANPQVAGSDLTASDS